MLRKKNTYNKYFSQFQLINIKFCYDFHAIRSLVRPLPGLDRGH